MLHIIYYYNEVAVFNAYFGNYFTGNHLTRKTPSAYADGVYMMAGQNRPSPRKLSQIFMRGQDGMGSMRNRTAILAFFGEYLFRL